MLIIKAPRRNCWDRQTTYIRTSEVETKDENGLLTPLQFCFDRRVSTVPQGTIFQYEKLLRKLGPTTQHMEIHPLLSSIVCILWQCENNSQGASQRSVSWAVWLQNYHHPKVYHPTDKPHSLDSTLCHLLLTYSMEQRPSCAASRSSASQEFPRILSNLKDHCRINKCPPPDPLHLTRFSKFHFNIILPSMIALNSSHSETMLSLAYQFSRALF